MIRIGLLFEAFRFRRRWLASLSLGFPMLFLLQFYAMTLEPTFLTAFAPACCLFVAADPNRIRAGDTQYLLAKTASRAEVLSMRWAGALVRAVVLWCALALISALPFGRAHPLAYAGALQVLCFLSVLIGLIGMDQPTRRGLVPTGLVSFLTLFSVVAFPALFFAIRTRAEGATPLAFYVYAGALELALIPIVAAISYRSWQRADFAPAPGEVERR